MGKKRGRIKTKVFGADSARAVDVWHNDSYMSSLTLLTWGGLAWDEYSSWGGREMQCASIPMAIANGSSGKSTHSPTASFTLCPPEDHWVHRTPTRLYKTSQKWVQQHLLRTGSKSGCNRTGFNPWNQIIPWRTVSQLCMHSTCTYPVKCLTSERENACYMIYRA